MKIGTDSVVLGAWAARFAAQTAKKKVLDIGTGCGIIALMIAQKTAACICAIEPEESAVITAQRNINSSPWKKSISLSHCYLQHYLEQEQALYDLIVCNPPYFNSSFLSENPGRSKARHDVSLGPEDLLEHCARLLTPEGTLLVIYPAEDSGRINAALDDARLYEHRRVYIYPGPGAKPVRVIREIRKEEVNREIINEHIAIETGIRHHFSKEYIALTKDYHPFLPD